MTDFEHSDDCLVGLHPFGDFPVWSKKNLQNTELPTLEMMNDIINQIAASL